MSGHEYPSAGEVLRFAAGGAALAELPTDVVTRLVDRILIGAWREAFREERRREPGAVSQPRTCRAARPRRRRTND